MKTNRKIGNIVIWSLLATTFFIWLFLRIETKPFMDIKTTLYSLSQIFSLLAVVMFSINFIMITRINFIQNSFGGLDKMYKTHQIIGKSAFLLILFHPILIVITSFPNIVPTLRLFFSFSYMPINFGIVALFLLIILVILTIFVKIKYQNWKISHKFMGLMFIIALFHIFMIGSDIGKYSFLKYYMAAISGLGLLSLIYSLLLNRFLKKRAYYYVESLSNNNNITIIKLKPKDKKLIYNPGQFVFIRIIDKKISKEQHPFTISSSPSEDYLEFSIKNLGDYTSKIRDISLKSEIQLEGPYGIFGNFNDQSKQIWISGGIGITPFLSMIKTLVLSKKDFVNIDFYYCVKNRSGAIFLDSITQLIKDIKNLKITAWYSEEKGIINADSIEKISSIKDSEIRICGPQIMMKSLREQFIKKGIKHSKIFFEDFNLK